VLPQVLKLLGPRKKYSERKAWFRMQTIEIIVVGASAGGVEALTTVLTGLPKTFNTPIVVAQHMDPSAEMFFTDQLNKKLTMTVKCPDDKDPIVNKMVYIAPAAYHLLIEEDHTFSLSTDPRVKYSRPSIDVLFESAAEVYEEKLIGVILTGANSDGSLGLKKIKEYGGLTIVQDPNTAKVGKMPRSAMEESHVDYVLALQQIAKTLEKLTTRAG